NAGQVIGFSYTAGNASYQPVVWNGTTPTVLGSLGGGAGQAYAINNSGQIVGFSGQIAGVSNGQAVIWNGTTPTALGGTSGSAIDINSAGQVVGSSYTPAVQAVVWNGITPTVLGTPPGTKQDISANSINDLGQIAGQFQTTSPATGSVFQAVVWN